MAFHAGYMSHDTSRVLSFLGVNGIHDFNPSSAGTACPDSKDGRVAGVKPLRPSHLWFMMN